MQEFKENPFNSFNNGKRDDGFSWPQYMRRLGVIILVLGCIVAIALAFTSIFITTGVMQKEFSLQGLIITVTVLLGSLTVHAVFFWMARMLEIAESKTQD